MRIKRQNQKEKQFRWELASDKNSKMEAQNKSKKWRQDEEENRNTVEKLLMFYRGGFYNNDDLGISSTRKPSSPNKSRLDG